MALVIAARAGEEGKLFGSVTNIDIEKALKAKGLEVERRRIHLAEPIKALGDYEVPATVPLGHALDNARLFSESESRLRETESLLAVAQALSSTLDPTEALETSLL